MGDNTNTVFSLQGELEYSFYIAINGQNELVQNSSMKIQGLILFRRDNYKPAANHSQVHSVLSIVLKCRAPVILRSCTPVTTL